MFEAVLVFFVKPYDNLRSSFKLLSEEHADEHQTLEASAKSKEKSMETTEKAKAINGIRKNNVENQVPIV